MDRQGEARIWDEGDEILDERGGWGKGEGAGKGRGRRERERAQGKRGWAAGIGNPPVQPHLTVRGKS